MQQSCKGDKRPPKKILSPQAGAVFSGANPCIYAAWRIEACSLPGRLRLRGRAVVAAAPPFIVPARRGAGGRAPVLPPLPPPAARSCCGCGAPCALVDALRWYHQHTQYQEKPVPYSTPGSIDNTSACAYVCAFITLPNGSSARGAPRPG